MHPISPPEDTQARSAAYQLLSALYYPPDESVGDALHSLAELWGEYQPDLLPVVARLQEAADPHELLHAYTPLFLGPFQLLAPPYGSVYLDGKREIMGASTQDVARLYRQAGLNLSDSIKEAPDHITIELEFMYYLIYRQTEALAGNDLAAATVWLDQQADFLHHHLGRWIGKFTEEVRRHTTSGSFYRNLAEVTLSFVERDYHSVYASASQTRQRHQPAS